MKFQSKLPTTFFLHQKTLFTSVLLLTALLQTSFGQMVPLTDLTPAAAIDRGGSNPLETQDPKKQSIFFNKAPEKRSLAIGDREYEKGIYVIATKMGIDYALEKEFSGFCMDVAPVKDGPMRFEVLGDGKTLFDSGPLENQEKRSLVLDVSQVETLALVFHKIEKGRYHVVLGDPYLNRKPAAPEPAPGETGNQPPKAMIDVAPQKGTAPLEVSFDGSHSSDPDDGVFRSTWSFGDGETEALSPNPTHTYALPGVYEVVLQVADNRGGTDMARTLITVLPTENQPPTAKIAASTRLAKPPAEIRFSAEPTADRDGEIVSYHWKFSDGSTMSGPKVSRNYSETGFDTATLTVTDNKGATATSSVRVRLDDGSNSTVFPVRDGSRILFINNSLLVFFGSVNDVFPQLAAQDEPPFELAIDTAGKGAGKVGEYVEWPSLGVQEHIMEGWDIVVIQPWTEMLTREPEKDFYPHVRTLVEWIRESGAVPILYEPQMAWRQFPGNQHTARERLQKIAQELDVQVIPAGEVWEVFFEKYAKNRDDRGNAAPDDEDDPGFVTMLYADSVHQNAVGAMLNNYILYKYLTGRSPMGLVPTKWGWKMEEQIQQTTETFFPEKDGGVLRAMQETADEHIQPHPAIQ